MTPLVTIIIPIAPYHVSIAARAIASAQAQTLPCSVLPVIDEQQRGAGWARNVGIARTETEHVVFLDADDELAPTFVERTLPVAQQWDRYVYTDWHDEQGIVIHAPDCAWIHQQFHAVTTLLKTDWARSVGGFDETLRTGGEDSEFYIHLVTENYCGLRLAEPLFVYHAVGQRSKTWKASPAFQQYRHLIDQRYTKQGKIMACSPGCSGNPPPPLPPVLQEAASGKVLVRPRWGGNRSERGAVTGTLYPRADWSTLIEMDPRDVKARPDLFELVSPPSPAQVYRPPAARRAENGNGVETPSFPVFAQQAMNAHPAAPPVESKPDIRGLLQKAARIANTNPVRTDATKPYLEFEMGAGEVSLMPPRQTVPMIHSAADPVFVFPDKDYPSYTDVRRLVELSGFGIVNFSDAHANDGRIYIHLSPEQPPHLSSQNFGRHIWWSLEYGGDYEPDLSNWRGAGEVWASDPAWAAAHHAKLVVMGSHPELADTALEWEKRYDAVQLAYMTPRRQALRDALADLRWPTEIYPGYDLPRAEQLVNSRFMLHVHQREDVHAIAPQRIALCAAYKLPLIAESVPDIGIYANHGIVFIDYANLNGELRSQLAMYSEGYAVARAEQLYQWLCVEHPFRASVEEALKS